MSKQTQKGNLMYSENNLKKSILYCLDRDKNYIDTDKFDEFCEKVEKVIWDSVTKACGGELTTENLTPQEDKVWLAYKGVIFIINRNYEDSIHNSPSGSHRINFYARLG